jgi:opacity protein-like surface antigen
MKKSLIGVVAALMACQTAFAADLYQAAPPAFIDTPPEVAVQEASGWYLRGDVGYSFNKSKSFEFSRANGGANTLIHSSRTSSEDSFLYGAGVGYQINNYLRTDLTFDYMAKSNFRGSAINAAGTGNDNFRSSLRAYSLLANAYVDLGTYGRITPYLGAGIGGAHVKWDTVKLDSGCCEFEGKGNWRFAYALMAGASIDVTCNLKADVGYRFRQIGSGEMFGGSGAVSSGRDKGLTSHEVRVGGRYVFNGCDTAQYIPPADIPLQPAVYK